LLGNDALHERLDSTGVRRVPFDLGDLRVGVRGPEMSGERGQVGGGVVEKVQVGRGFACVDLGCGRLRVSCGDFFWCLKG
jgi:hypothetical protein